MATKKRMKIYSCEYREHYYDDLSNCQLCNSPDNDSRTCDCKTMVVQNHCPFFSPDKQHGMEVEIDKHDENDIKEYEDKLMKRVRDKIYSITRNSKFVERTMNFLNRKREEND